MSKEKIINIEAQRSLEAQFEARILRDEKIEAKDDFHYLAKRWVLLQVPRKSCDDSEYKVRWRNV